MANPITGNYIPVTALCILGKNRKRGAIAVEVISKNMFYSILWATVTGHYEFVMAGRNKTLGLSRRERNEGAKSWIQSTHY